MTKKGLPSAEYEEQLGKNLALGWKPSDILKADKDQLLTMQHRLCLGNAWGRIELPAAFIPAGGGQHNCKRIFILSQYLPSGMDDGSPSAKQIWIEVLRFTIARLTQSGSQNSQPVRYSTLAVDLRVLQNIVRTLAQTPMQEDAFWSRVDVAALKNLKLLASTLSAIWHFHRIGALPDAISDEYTIKGDEPERDRTDEPELEEPVNQDTSWQPLPMPLVAQVGWRSLRLIKVIAPALLNAMEQVVAIPLITHNKNGQPLSQKQSKEQTAAVRNKAISGWKWHDENGAPIEAFGFKTLLKDCQGNIVPWPPRSFHHAYIIAHSLLKPAHLWMVLLGNGKRNGEMVSMRSDCLIPTANGQFKYKNKTYKMTGIEGGNR